VKKILETYKQVDRNIYKIILAQFFIQMMNAAFGLLRNYFMLSKGYKDFEIANFTSYNYIAITLIAFPLGLYIKGKKLRAWFITAMCFLPLIAFLEIYAIDHQLNNMIILSMFCWGIAFACLSATVTPYLLLNSEAGTHTEVMALTFQTFTFSMIFVGILHFLFKHFYPVLSIDRNFLYLISALSAIGLVFLFRIKNKEITSARVPLSKAYKTYDWQKIFATLIPTTIIAIGAGLTIQFINLFFENVHGVDSNTFAMMGASTYVLVAIGTFIIPTIKRSFGYEVAITLVQVIAIIILVGLASTEWYKERWYAVYIAIFLFIIRQPLMNVAGPMTSELTMNYVGEKNRELVSSLTASIWSGSWFFSAKIFEILRSLEVSYSYILLVTAFMYSIGVYAYQVLIKKYHKQIELVQS
jgi:hypothetical protein